MRYLNPFFWLGAFVGLVLGGWFLGFKWAYESLTGEKL